jgi:hypothetical protein
MSGVYFFFHYISFACNKKSMIRSSAGDELGVGGVPQPLEEEFDSSLLFCLEGWHAENTNVGTHIPPNFSFLL